jgi:hypothetical protein
MTHISKTILRHMLLNHDVKVEEGAERVRPKDMWLGSNCLLNGYASVGAKLNQ